MSKKVLVMCTGNSCRSIIGEALINAFLDEVSAYSCGVKPNGVVNSNAKKVLQNHNIWDDSYHPKNFDEVLHIDFDLVVTVCDNAKETCPMFPNVANSGSEGNIPRKPVKKIHIGFVDPDGKEYSEFEKTYKEIKKRLLPRVEEALN
ncbi:MAG: arsenate reductase ArsC [Sulfurospirillum sp.]